MTNNATNAAVAQAYRSRQMAAAGWFAATFIHLLLIGKAAAPKLRYSWLCCWCFNVFYVDVLERLQLSRVISVLCVSLQYRLPCVCIAPVNFMKQKRHAAGKHQQLLVSAYIAPCSASKQAQLTCPDYTNNQGTSTGEQRKKNTKCLV